MILFNIIFKDNMMLTLESNMTGGKFSVNLFDNYNNKIYFINLAID